MSIIPPTLAQRLNGPTSTQLQAANGSKIPCYGTRNMAINLSDRSLTFPITIADVKHAILGADFLAHAYLAPNHRDGTLIDLKDYSVLKADFDNTATPIRINLVDHTTDPYYQLLDKFPDLSNPSFRVTDVKHGVKHYIPTDGPPVQARARKLPPDKLAVAKAEIEKLVELGVCVRGKSEWASPLLVTTKPCSAPCTCETNYPCGGWRVCGDYRRLNHMTTDDKYPVRNLQDFNSNLRGKKIFSKIDLLKGYHQIPVNGDDVKKTAVITPFGLYLFPRCPFGLKNAGQDFQRLMDEILGDIPYYFVYLDDILVASHTKEEHLQHLQQLFEILDQNGLVVNRKKCLFGQSSLDFLGHHVDADGIRPQADKVEAILATKPPTSVKELRRFLGMINYYRRFVKAAAEHLFFLFCALKDNPKKLVWSSDMQTSFDRIKQVLAERTMLHHPDSSLPLALTTDASLYAIGGVLEQRGPMGWEPLGFFSKKLTTSQQDWCPFDRELQAVHAGVRHFKHMLEGRPFTIYTDHQSLVPSIGKKTDAPTARQRNQLAEIAEYTTDIRYLEGKANVVADALSRPNGEEPAKSAFSKPPTVSNVETVDIPFVHVFQEAMVEFGIISVNAISHLRQRPTQLTKTVTFAPPNSSTSVQQATTNEKTDKAQQQTTPPSILKDTRSTPKPHPTNPELEEFDRRMKAQILQHPELQRFLPPTELSPPPLAAEAAPDKDIRESQKQMFKALRQEIFDEEENTQQEADAPAATESSDKPLPQTKLEDLQSMVNAIDHFEVDLEEMARQQPLDPEFQRMSADARTGLNFRKVRIGNNDLFVDVSNGPARPFVPAAFRRHIFQVIHGLGHPGVQRTVKTICAKFVWPNIRAETALWARQCIDCQRAKITRHTVPPIGNFTVPAKRFAHIHADLVTMPPSNGFTHLLTIVDRFSRWPVAVPIKDIAGDTVIDALTHNWISAYGVPEVITTDRGSQFTSCIWTQLLTTWGIKHIKTTAYHPESNGMVERLHRRLKESLIALGNNERARWYWKLPMAMLALRTTVKKDLDAAPSDLVYGGPVTVPGQLIPSQQPNDEDLLQQQRQSVGNLRMEVERLQPTQTSTHRTPTVHIPQDLRTCTHVFVLRGGVQPGLTAPYDGPFRVVAKEEHGFRVNFPGRGTDLVALARLRPAFVAPADQDGNDDQNLDEHIPDSPPPPGRRPGLRTRVPDPTSRVTRSQTHSRQSNATSDEPIRRSQPGIPYAEPSTSAAARQLPPLPEDDEEPYVPTPFDPNFVDIPADPNLAAGPSRSENFAMMQAEAAATSSTEQRQNMPAHATSDKGGASTLPNSKGKRVLSFSKPKPNNFSYRRKRPDVSAIQQLLSEHLNL